MSGAAPEASTEPAGRDRAAPRPGAGLVPLAEARAHVLSGLSALAPVPMALGDALGCVTATGIFATGDVPPFTNSAMDGYALRSVDTTPAGAELRVVGEIMAGQVAAAGLAAGEALRIMTGAPLPAGADAVCMVERTHAVGGRPGVFIDYELQPGENVRPAGSDVRAGTEVLPAGSVLSAGGLALLAGVGVAEVLVHPRPVVGVLATGDELVADGHALGPGQIHESNRVALLALVGASNAIGLDLGIVDDDEARVVAALNEAAARCDVIVSSGGVSVGDRDVVKAVLGGLAGESMRWMQVAIRPAKPFAFGRIGPRRVPLFGLPGNPVSSMVSFELFARPALRRLAGHRQLERPTVTAVADEGLPRRPDGKLHLVRVTAHVAEDGLVHVHSAGGQESHQLHAMARANALSLVADGDGVPPGGRVDTMLLDPEVWSPARDGGSR